MVNLRVVTGSALVSTHRVHAMPHGHLEACDLLVYHLFFSSSLALMLSTLYL